MKSKWKTKLEKILNDLEEVHAGTQDDWENKSERWQESDTGQEEETHVESLEYLVDQVSELIAEVE